MTISWRPISICRNRGGSSDEYKYGVPRLGGQLLVPERQGSPARPSSRSRKMKSEPGWMRDVRLKAARMSSSGRRPNPTWGGESPATSTYDVTSATSCEGRRPSGEDLGTTSPPRSRTSSRQARQHPRGRAASSWPASAPPRHDSEVVYPQPPRRPPEEGRHLPALTWDTALREHEDLVKQVFRHDHPDPTTTSSLAAQHGRFRSRRLVRLRTPAGVGNRHPRSRAYFLIDNAENMGQFEPTLILVEEAGSGPPASRAAPHGIYTRPRACTLAVDARRGSWSRRAAGAATPPSRTGAGAAFQPGDQASGRPGRRPDGVGRRQPRPVA